MRSDPRLVKREPALPPTDRALYLLADAIEELEEVKTRGVVLVHLRSILQKIRHAARLLLHR